MLEKDKHLTEKGRYLHSFYWLSTSRSQTHPPTSTLSRFNTGTPERLQLGAKSSVTDFFSIDLAADWEAMGDSSFWSVVEAALDPIFPNEDGHPRPSDDRNHSPPLSVGQRSMPTHHHIKEKQERTATRNGNAYFIAHMTPGPPVIVDSVVPAWKRLISDTLLPQELISLIEEIFVNKDEVKAISGLLGDDAQVFINTIHKVCPLFFLSRGTI